MDGMLESASEALGGALSVVSPGTRTAPGLEQVAGQVSMMFRTQSVRVRNTVMNGAGAENRTRESRFERLERSPVSPEMETRTGDVRR